MEKLRRAHHPPCLTAVLFMGLCLLRSRMGYPSMYPVNADGTFIYSPLVPAIGVVDYRVPVLWVFYPEMNSIEISKNDQIHLKIKKKS